MARLQDRARESMHGKDGSKMARGRVAPAVLAVVLWGAATALAAAGPRLEVPHPVVDLGVVHRGEVIEARYALHNRGDALLRIFRAEPG